jgi:hypothetical protein
VPQPALLPGGSKRLTFMIGFLSRFIGLWFVAGGLVALVIDATRSIAASALIVTPLGQAISSYSVSTLMSFQQFIQQRIEPYAGGWLWDPVIQGILTLPTFVVLGAVGFLFTWLGGRRRRRTASFA